MNDRSARPESHEGDRPPGGSANGLLVAVFVGGAAGGLLRWGLAQWLDSGGESGAWPWGTLVANVGGTFVLGVTAVTLLHRADHPQARLSAALGPGFCGALTTFSTLQIEIVRLLHEGHAATALAYLAATLIAGYGAIRIGHARPLGRVAVER